MERYQKQCPSCEGSGRVGVVTVDHPSAPLVLVECKACAGRGVVCELDALAYMAGLRGEMSQREASEALGWPHWRWGSVERGYVPLAHVLMYRWPGKRAGWPSVRAALAAWTGRVRVLGEVAS